MNEFEILLSGLLDEQKTLSNIETGITNLQSKLKGKINIEINIGDISQQINDVSNQIKSIGKASKGVGLDDDPLADYKESLKETLHQYKMGTVDLETYVKKMQSLIFENGSTYSENFLSIEDNKQEKYVRELTKAYEEQRKALDEVAKTKKNLNTIPTENANNQNADPFLQYRSSLQKTIHEVRMGTTDLETYIKKLQSLIYNDDATYKAEFLNLTDAQQEKYVQALTSAYAEQQRALDEVTKTRQKNYTELVRESDAQSKNSTDQAIAIDKLRTSLSEMNKAYGSFVNQSKANSLLAQIKDLEKMNPATVQYRNNLKLIQNETKKLGVESRNAFKQAQDAISDTTAKTGSLGLAFRTLGQFFMIGSPIMVISKTFKELVSTVNEANKSLTDIQMVTGMSSEEANKLALTYNELGQQIGATTQEILTGSVEWFRAGKTIQETEELIQASIVGSKMAGIETAQMTEYLTSALNGYQLEASEAMNVIDKMVAIDNNASTSLSELATAMSYTANIARATGLDMDSLLGNIGAVSEATRQSAETIGQSFKTLITRYQDIKLGKFNEDGLVTSDVIKTLESAGVQVKDSENSWRDFGSVLDELASKWDGFSQAEQSAIGKALAGTRQREMFVALMENYGKATELTTLAIESNGTALDRYNNVYLDSTQAKMDSLKATLEGLFLEALTSNTINSFIDGATNVLKFIDACGGLIPVLTDIVGLLVIIKSQAIASFAMGVWGNITSIGSTIASAFFGATASVTGLSTALTALNFNPVVLAITALVGGGLLLKNAFDEANVSTAELKTELADLQAKATNMSSLSAEYEELASKTQLSAEESERFVEVQNQLKELIPDLNGYYDENGNFIATNTAQIEENTDAMLKSIDAKKGLLALEGRENIRSEISDVEQYKSSVEELQKYLALKEQVGSTSMLTNDDLTNMGISEDDIRILNQYDAMLGSVENAQSELEVVSKEYAKSVDESRQSIVDMISATESYNVLTSQEQNIVKKAISNMSPEELIRKWQMASNNTGGFIYDIIEKAEEMSEKVNESIENIDADNVDLSGLTEGLERTKEDIVKTLSEVDSKVKELNSIIKEVDSEHGISGESMLKIINDYPELLQYIDDETTLREKLSEKMQEYENEFSNSMRELVAEETNYYNEANAQSEEYYKTKILANESTCTQILSDLEDLYKSMGLQYTGDLENYKSLEQMKAKVTSELIVGLEKAWKEHFSSVGKTFGELATKAETLSKLQGEDSWLNKTLNEKYPELSADSLKEEAFKQTEGIATKATKDLTDLMNQYESIADTLNKYTLDPVTVDVGGIDASNAKNEKKEKDKNKEALEAIKRQSDAINAEIETMYQKIEMAESLGNKETAKKLEDDLVKLYDRRKKIIHSQAEQMRALLAKTNDAELQSDIVNEISSLQGEYHDTQIDIIERRLERVEEVHQKTLDGLEEELKVLERQRLLLDEESPDYLKTYRTEYQIILKQIESTEKALASLRTQGFGEDTESIKNLKKELSDYQTAILEVTKEFRDAVQSQIETARDNMEELLNYTVDMLKEETEKKKKALEREYKDRKEMLEKQQDDEEKALKDRLDMLKREADARKDALDKESDEKSYNDELAEKQKEIAELQNQLSVISLDDTKSKEQKQLRDEIAKKKKELEDFQYDRGIELQKQAIDDELALQEDKIETELDRLKEQNEQQLEYYEDLYESQKDIYEDYLDDEVGLRQEANRRMNLDSKSFYEELKAYVTSYCGVTESEFDEMWRVASEGMEVFGNGQKDVLSNLDEMTSKIIALKTQLQSLSAGGLGAYLNGTGDVMTDTSPSNNKYNGLTDKSEREEYRDEQLQKLIDLGDAMNGADKQTVASLKAQQQAVASTIGAYMQNGTYYIMINGKKYPVRQAIGVRHSGLDTGEVGNKNGFKIKSNEELNLLEKGEMVVTPQQSFNIMNNVKAIANDANKDSMNLVLDLHDFAITDNNYDNFKSYLTKEIPKILNGVLSKKGIR